MMLKSCMSFLVVLLCLGVVPAVSAQDATFTLLPFNSALHDMSDDAQIFVGEDFTTGALMRYHADGTVEGIGGMGSPDCSATAGDICAGITDAGYDQAALWLGGTNWQALGGIGGTSGSSMSTAYDISRDGSTVVGLGWISAGTAHAFAWDAVNGMVDLGSLGGESSRANAVSTDGTVIVGWDQDASTGWWRSARWVNGVEELLAPGTYAGDCQGVSSDGTWIVGNNHPNNMDGGFLYSDATGFTDLGTLSGWQYQGHPLDVSDDGKVVVGWSGYFMDQFATIWTEDTGMVLLSEYLLDLGATIPAGMNLSIASAVSNDGTVIIGWAQDMMWNTQGFIATIPAIVDNPLSANTSTLSAATGGTVDFSLKAGSDQAGRDYFLLATTSGTNPGTPLPYGETLPLNWDVLTDTIIKLVPTSVCTGFSGTLDGDGKGTAVLDTLGPLPSTTAGIVMDFAYLLYYPFDYVSNPVSIEITP